ncbi:hypothetical protein H8356DRAFT_1355664 [Neocallimastix lanati (nom. inval.)]|nr:hypothetical protein H8356DRAFT_1355664 [Neocallimastix sp. JGI-2020a]
MVKAAHYVNLKKISKTDQNGKTGLNVISNVIYLCLKESTVDPLQNNLKYSIPNIQGNSNNRMVHSTNNSIIKPSIRWKFWILGGNGFLTDSLGDYEKSYFLLYSHKLRWYNITLQEKGVLDISNINELQKQKKMYNDDDDDNKIDKNDNNDNKIL